MVSCEAILEMRHVRLNKDDPTIILPADQTYDQIQKWLLEGKLGRFVIEIDKERLVHTPLNPVSGIPQKEQIRRIHKHLQRISCLEGYLEYDERFKLEMEKFILKNNTTFGYNSFYRSTSDHQPTISKLVNTDDIPNQGITARLTFGSGNKYTTTMARTAAHEHENKS